MVSKPLTISIENAEPVSGIWQGPAGARACLVLAHGAGAGMRHKSIASIADGLAARDIATLRYQFPYMEQGSRRPDRPAVAHATVRAAVEVAKKHSPALPLFAGGKSFGGRMTSQAQALKPLDAVRGLVFFGFPLHPAGKASSERATHLSDVRVPMLFLQGTRDALADLDQLRPVIETLRTRATLKLFDNADHSFHVPAKSGRKDADLLDEILDLTAAWMIAVSIGA
jgi:predicted alpha/beta-hydrolase family hydrolase